MKKKYSVPNKDKNYWINFTKRIGDVISKETDTSEQNLEEKKLKKLDLHGFSLDESNKIVKKFVIESFNLGRKKILIVTGKGTRSKSYDNPYSSEKLSVLKNSVPEFIKNDENLKNKIVKISKASIKDGGDGTIYIYLKNNKNL